MEYLGNMLFIIIIIFIIGGMIYQEINKKRENFVVQSCYTCGHKWDDCYDNCLNIYDQARSEICKEKCNDNYLFI